MQDTIKPIQITGKMYKMSNPASVLRENSKANFSLPFSKRQEYNLFNA